MKKKLKVNEHRNAFVQSMERERFARNWSVADMAEAVGLSKSAYYRILSNGSVGIPFRVVLHTHELTGLPMWQLCGMEMPEEFKFSIKYLQMSAAHREEIDKIIDLFLELEKS